MSGEGYIIDSFCNSSLPPFRHISEKNLKSEAEFVMPNKLLLCSNKIPSPSQISGKFRQTHSNDVYNVK